MTETPDRRIHWEHNWDAALDRVRRERRFLLIDVEKDH
jgi:hypothetical protein